MSCGDIELRIPDFVAGHLEDEEARDVDAHLSSCRACDSYCQSVKALYSLDLDAPALDLSAGPQRSLPVAPVAPHVTRVRGWPRLAQQAALVLIVVLLGLLVWQKYIAPPSWQPLQLQAFAIDLEALPEAPDRGAWLSELETAERLSQLTGLPIIEEYGMSMCPLCQHLEEQLDQPQSRELLVAFVRFRGSLDGLIKNDRTGIPDWVFQIRDGQRLLYQPAMRIQWDDDHVTEPIYSVMSTCDLRTLLDRWQPIADRLDVPALGIARFSELRTRLVALPQMLEQRRLAEALTLLEDIVELDGQRRTTLVEVARDLLVQMDAQIDRQITEIERLHDGTRVEHYQAVDLAERLADQLGTHPSERLQQYR